MINRKLRSEILKAKKSILLLGPRQVGKSTLISSLKPDLSINLANEMDLLNFSTRPDELEKLIRATKPKTIFIDEIQRLPRLLNTLQAIIDENKSLKFYLTGSSARKLKRGEANLLPGRVLNFKLGPLVASELDYEVDLERALSVGFLPEMYLEKKTKDAIQNLRSYGANYLKEEIKAEALTRNLESFARFMNEIALSNAQFIDYTKLAQRTKISRHAVPRYFEILEDTMIGQRIWPLEQLLESEDLIRHPKFYFFDVGVQNSLIGNFVPSRDRIGSLAEQMIYNQMLHASWAMDQDVKISTFRTRKGIEVDFILENGNKTFAIEVKTSGETGSSDLEGLSYFNASFKQKCQAFVFHLGDKEKKFGSIWSLPWAKGIKAIGL
jgi:predicted AAA+ superfamily ATPase